MLQGEISVWNKVFRRVEVKMKGILNELGKPMMVGRQNDLGGKRGREKRN